MARAYSNILMSGLLVLSAVVAPGLVWAQPDAAGSGTALTHAFAAGIEALEEGVHQAAIVHLESVFEENPGFVTPAEGTAAYWLGRAYEAAGEPERASVVWATGWRALMRDSLVDLRLADALIWSSFEHRRSDLYNLATAAYLTLLQHLPGLSQEADRLRERYLIPLEILMTEQERAQLGFGTEEAEQVPTLTPATADALVTWWRRADTLPGTFQNEWLEEHLERVTFAAAKYADTTAATGLDDRGLVYIRLGPPSHRKALRYLDMDYLSNASNPSLPESEFWVYRHVDDRAQYLFLWRPGKGGHRLGLPYDVIPQRLRHSQRFTRPLLEVMEELYRDLALYHPRGHYGAIYDKVANYKTHLEMNEFSASLGGGASTPLPQPPMAFAQSVLAEARSSDTRAAHQRDEEGPTTYSSVYDDVEALPVAIRWSRFLEQDGTTRTELYWSLKADELQPSRRLRRRLRRAGHTASDDYLLNLTVLRQDQAYRTRAIDRKHHLLRLEGIDQTSVVPVQSFKVGGDSVMYHLALQWDAHWVEERSEEQNVAPGPRVKLGTYRVDSLKALHANPGRLEMSDLKPLRVAAGGLANLDQSEAYPYMGLTPDVQLALYFEIYHLSFGPDDRTRYTVEYEVVRSRVRRGLLRLRGRGEPEQRTQARTHYEGDSRVARETVLLDLTPWERAGTLDVIVHITDDVSGQSVERSVRFELIR